MSSMTRTVTRLDEMLYAWLTEPDDRKFDRAFEKYHDEAFAGLVRYLARCSRSLGLDFEQIAADALLRFFSRVGRERREASDLISNALTQIHPLDLGSFHVREVRCWTAEVGSFRETSMTFKVTQQEERRNWMAEIQALAEKIPPLQRQGGHVLESVRAAISPARDGAARDGAAHEGATLFVEFTVTIVESLPLLRVPTNGYLFDIAQSSYLDECKSRGRLKRRGPDTWHPLNRINPDDEESSNEYSDQIAAAPMQMVFASDLADAAVDPESDLAGEDFCEKFYAYLRRPLDLAEEAYRIAAANGPAKAERKRMDSLGNKLDRVIGVLTMRIEGHTQEDIARVLDLSRNQVKYIAELVQEAYEQFSAMCARSLVRSPAAGANSYVER
jgi:DNA-directed RNA polymerase specialized sigma24 family protein